MPRFFIKAFEISLWAIIPLVLISNIALSESSLPAKPITETYSLRATGSLDQELSGTMVFETSTETLNESVFSVLKLRFQSNRNNAEHAMEFLISKRDLPDGISVGTYDIARDKNGFLNYVDGVFGFADIEVLGELPFFAQNGKIAITYLDSEMVKGAMNVSLKNTEGEKIKLTGDFVALK